MKKLLLATLALASFATPSQAGVLIPDMYAQKFCTSRLEGKSINESMETATRYAYTEGEEVKVMFHGVEVDKDVIDSLTAARQLCPQYM